MESPWLTICSTLPDSDWSVTANVPSTMNPRWAIDEYATSRFRSCCIVATMAPYVMPITASVRNSGRLHHAASGNRYSPNRSRPYVPSFSMTPARITEPAVGAWVWASGSHVCSGKIGTLTAKATAKAKNSHRPVVAGNSACSAISTRSNVSSPDAVVAGQEHRRDDPDEHERRAEHREQEELQRRVLPALVAPPADEEVHRHEHDLEEDEEHEQVEAEEAAHHAGLEQQQPGEVRLLVVMWVGAEDGEREQHAGQHDEEQRDPVDAEVPRDAPLLDPRVLRDELEPGVVACRTATSSQMLSAPVKTLASRPTSLTSSGRRLLVTATASAPATGDSTIDGEDREAGVVH